MGTKQAGATRLGRAPRILGLSAAYALFLALLVEGGAFAALSLRSGRPTSAAAFEEQLAAVAGQDVATGVPTGGATEVKQGIHPYLGFLARDEVSANSTFEGGVALHDRAFYGPDSPVFDTSPDVVVVAVLGGSLANQFTRFGGGEVLADELRRIPQFAGKEVRYALLAHGGYKQPQHLLALTYVLALGGRVDVAINLDGFNEIALHEIENHRQGVSPIYPRSWFFRVQRAEILPLLGELEVGRRVRGDAARAAAASPWRRSWTYRLAWKLRDERLARNVERAERDLRAFEPEQRADLVLTGPESSADTLEERLDELAALWQHGSLQLERLCRANEVEFFQFLQPNQYVADSKPLSDTELREAYRADASYAPHVPAGYQRLQAAARTLVDEGVRYLDLTPAFADVEETVYVDTCCHINEFGNAILAREIGTYMASCLD